MISRVWSSCLQSCQSCLDPRKQTQWAPRSWTHLPALPKARKQAMEQQSITVQYTSNMMSYMAWYARYDMQCICVLRKGNNDQCINLANQVCRWKDEMISVEIDMKITGNGCTVCKWQATQEWHNSVINSTMLLSMQQETKLLYSNIATKYMKVMSKRCLTNHKH